VSNAALRLASRVRGSPIWSQRSRFMPRMPHGPNPCSGQMGLPSSVLDRLPDVLGGIGKEAWMPTPERPMALRRDGRSHRRQTGCTCGAPSITRPRFSTCWFSAARRARGTPADAQAAQENNGACAQTTDDRQAGLLWIRFSAFVGPARMSGGYGRTIAPRTSPKSYDDKRDKCRGSSRVTLPTVF
jgi:hypothetical protein